MLEFIVLIERSLRAVRLGTGFDGTFVEPLNFMGISAESFGLFISFKGAVAVIILSQGNGYFIFAEAILEMIFLVDEFLDLVGEGDIGKEESAVLLVVVIFGGVVIAGVRK